MRHLLLILLGLLVSLKVYCQNPVPNFSFEDWTDSEPNEWFTSNIPESDLFTVMQVSPGYRSPFAISGIVISDPGGSGVLTPLIESNTDDFGFDLEEEFAFLTLYYTFQPGSAEDFLAVNISILDDQGSIYGSGYIETKSPRDTFTRLSIPITYQEGKPTKAIISFTVGSHADFAQPSAGTSFTIDALSLEDQTTSSVETPGLFPDLAIGMSNSHSLQISFTAAQSYPYYLSILNSLGQTCGDVVKGIAGHGRNELSLNASSLFPGIYFLRLQTRQMDIQKPFFIH